MSSDLEHIDDYLSGDLGEEERRSFERRMAEDPGFAEEVAFHLSALAAAREAVVEERKSRFRKLDEEIRQSAPRKVVPVRWLRPALSAAAVLLLIGVAWVFFLKAPEPHELAQQYIKAEWSRTGVDMGGGQDALTSIRDRFNAGDLLAAGSALDSLLAREPANAEGKKLSGIVSLRLGDHDKALARFRELAAMPGLYANQGRFLEAVVLMDRDAAGDKEKAKEALEEVVRKGTGGIEQARKWLKHF